MYAFSHFHGFVYGFGLLVHGFVYRFDLFVHGFLEVSALRVPSPRDASDASAGAVFAETRRANAADHFVRDTRRANAADQRPPDRPPLLGALI